MSGRVPPAFWAHPLRASLRILTSLVRLRVLKWSKVEVVLHPLTRKMIFSLRTPLGLTLYRYGLWDQDLHLVHSALRPGDVAVDIGANVGLYTIVAADAVGVEGVVYAIEPSPYARERLEQNLALNGIDWVIVLPFAAGRVRGRGEFRAFAGVDHGLSSFAPADAGGSEAIAVDIDRVDALVRMEHRARVRLVKIDAEGSECAVVAGAEQVLREAGPLLLIEVEDEHLRRQGCSAAELHETLEGLDYVGTPTRSDQPNFLFKRRTEGSA